LSLANDELPDPDMLVKDAPATDECAIAHLNKPAEESVVGDDHVIPDLYVMPEVNGHHQKAAVPDSRN
jgi:hypothetical protein